MNRYIIIKTIIKVFNRRATKHPTSIPTQCYSSQQPSKFHFTDKASKAQKV